MHLRPASLPGPEVLVIEPAAGYNWVVDACERPDLRTKIEVALRIWLGRPVEVRFVRPVEDRAPAPARHPGALAKSDNLAEDSLVKHLVKIFEARAVRIEEEDDTPAGP